MEATITSEEIKRLTVEERIPLVEEIWDSIAADQESLSLTPAQVDELDRRLEAYEGARDFGSKWEAAKYRITSRT